MKSLIQEDMTKCYFCGRPATCTHHVFYGTANRKMSSQYNCLIRLCGHHHNMSDDSVHFNKDMDLLVKRRCQEAFEEQIGTREMFMNVFGRNYL